MQIILEFAVYVKVRAFSEAVEALLHQLHEIHVKVLAQRQITEISDWQECLKEIHVNLRESLLRMPNEPLDHHNAYVVNQSMRKVAHMVLECREVTRD